MRVKHEGRKFKCDVEGCVIDFNTSSGLRTHMKAVHQPRETCHICNVKVRRGFLKHHLKLSHQKNLKCAFCEKCYATEKKLEIHERTHLGIKDFRCKFCDKKFHLNRFLIQHVRDVHQMTKFNCRIPGCNGVLNTRKSYRKHILNMHKSLSEEDRKFYYELTRGMKPDSYLELDELIREDSPVDGKRKINRNKRT